MFRVCKGVHLEWLLFVGKVSYSYGNVLSGIIVQLIVRSTNSAEVVILGAPTDSRVFQQY